MRRFSVDKPVCGFVLLLLICLCLYGCGKSRSVKTVDLALDPEPDEFAYLTEEPLAAAETVLPTAPAETTSDVPLTETQAAATVYVSSPESTVYVPATQTTVFVSTPQSTAYVTAQTQTETTITQPAVEITFETTVPTQAAVPATEAVVVRSAPQPDDTVDPAAQDYVLNKNSKKFHYPGCASVSQMKPSNRDDVHSTRDELIAQGYSPCGRCKP